MSSTKKTDTPTDSPVETPTENPTETPTETSTETAVESVTDTVATTTEAVTDTVDGGSLDDAIGRARDQLLSLLQHGQDAVNKGYERVVDRIENIDLQELPGYGKLSSIETPGFDSESLGGYVSKADELFQTGREQVTEQINKATDQATEQVNKVSGQVTEQVGKVSTQVSERVKALSNRES